MRCKLVDVFSNEPFSGNSLTILDVSAMLSNKKMQDYTRELRQFESIFVSPTDVPNTFDARIFTMEEELEFAGHPILGLAAHLHDRYGTQQSHQWKIKLREKTIDVSSRQIDHYYHTVMHQGPPEFIKQLGKEDEETILSALNLDSTSLANMPMEVISTGLPYLIVPVCANIADARISVPDFESLLGAYGAKFVYVIDITTREGRTWDNDGRVEDIATGSAAGPAAAYLWKQDLIDDPRNFTISQGRFVGRPCEMNIQLKEVNGEIIDILLGGDVCHVADIQFVFKGFRDH